MAQSIARSLSLLGRSIDSSGDVTTDAISPNVSLGGGVTVYSSRSNLPVSGNTAGDQALTSDTNRLYIWNGSGWYNVALLNVAPSIQSVLDSDSGATPFSLATDGTATTITITAADSDGDPLIYTASSDSDFSGLATLSQTSNVFTITPLSQDSATTTSGTITFTATDGINVASSGIQSFTLNFLPALWDETVLSVGTSSTNSLNNSTFIDRSTNAHTVTPTGSPVQTAFHPYLDNWSLDTNNSGSNDGGHLRTSYETPLGTSDFSIEAWVFYVSGSDGWTGNRKGVTSGGFSSRMGATSMSIGLASGSQYNAVLTTSSYPDITNKWTHVAICRSSGTTSIYVDGTRYATTSTSLDWNLTNQWVVGFEFDASESSDLYMHISDYRLVNGSSAYDATQTSITVPTEKLTAITNTQILTCQDNRFVDNSGNGVTFDIRHAPKISAFSPFGQASEYAPGENKGSFYADGDDYLELSTADVDFVHEGSNFTIQGWVHSTSSQGDQVRWCGTGIGSADRAFVCWIDYASANINLRICNLAGFTDNTFAFTENVVKESWNHVAFCHDGSNLTAYWNGEKSSTSIATASVGFVSGAATGNLMVGRTSDSGLNWINGYISDFKISTVAEYSSTFTPSTTPVGNTNAVLYLPMDNAGIYDKTGNNTLALAGNTATSTTQTKFATTSMYFDGSGDYIFCDNTGVTLNSDFTMEMWVYQTQQNTYPTLFSNVNAGNFWGTNAWTLHSSHTTAVGKFTAWFYNINQNAASLTSTTTINNNTWYHLAITRSGNNWYLFVNGNLESTMTNSTTIDNGAEDIYLSSHNSAGSTGFFGYIENAQILNGVAKYTANFTPPVQTQGRQYQAES